MRAQSAVALGGGHGLHASLTALRHLVDDLVVDDLTAIVTVADNGGSSGRLRGEFGVLPPGDLRMALAALCGEDDWGATWARVLQHRFAGDGEMRGVWDVVGRTLCSDEVRQAFVRRLAYGLRRRFGDDFGSVGMYPIPILTRDVPGYLITPHTDTRWKGITVQIYLPPDEAHPHIGTIFHERMPEGGLVKKTQMRFAPNSGYAFAVGDDTWHSADPVGPEVTTRDSILLTYFVDSGVFKHLRNRLKRAGNFLANELRYASQPWLRRPTDDRLPRA